MKCVLNDIVKDIQTGPFGSQLHRSDYSDEGTPVIMPQDIVDWNISTEKIVRVGNSHVERLVRHKVEYLDIVYPRRGDVSKCAQITNEIGWLCGTGCLKVKIDSEKANPQYVFYYLQQPHVGKWIELHSTGATMMNINSSTLRELPLDIPAHEIQNTICEIISNYDSLIANCRKQIALLEEAAQRLYREWFVNFRFPGHESTQIIDALPQGWKRGTVRECLRIKSGKDHKILKDGHYPVYGSGGIMRYGDKYLFDKPSILIPRKGSLNNIMLAEGKFWTIDTMFYTEIVSDEYLYYVYLQIKDWDLYSQNIGAAVPSMNTTILYGKELLFPTDNLVVKFNESVKHTFASINLLKKEIADLLESRNMLLPHLMSGEIDVSEISNHCLENSVGKNFLHTGQPSSGT